MNLASWIITILFAVAFVGAVRYVKRNGVCSECKGGCGGCGGKSAGGGHCDACAQAEKMLQGIQKEKR